MNPNGCPVTDWMCITPSVTSDGGDAGGLAYCDGACIDVQASCPSGQVQCDASCVDLSSSNDHCGFCDQACNGALICVDGKCGCPPGLSDCAGYCVDLTTEPSGVCPGDTAGHFVPMIDDGGVADAMGEQ
jgi:hypothetical protein